MTSTVYYTIQGPTYSSHDINVRNMFEVEEPVNLSKIRSEFPFSGSFHFRLGVQVPTTATDDNLNDGNEHEIDGRSEEEEEGVRYCWLDLLDEDQLLGDMVVSLKQEERREYHLKVLPLIHSEDSSLSDMEEERGIGEIYNDTFQLNHKVNDQVSSSMVNNTNQREENQENEEEEKKKNLSTIITESASQFVNQTSSFLSNQLSNIQSTIQQQQQQSQESSSSSSSSEEVSMRYHELLKSQNEKLKQTGEMVTKVFIIRFPLILCCFRVCRD